MTELRDNTIRFTEAKIELYEIIENLSKIAENNLHTSRVQEKDFETLMDLMRDTIGSAKYVVGFLKEIFNFSPITQSTEITSPSKELIFAHGEVGTDENENKETGADDNQELDDSTGSLYNSFEEVHFFETPKNISKRKKCRNLVGSSSSFEDSLDNSRENEAVALELFGDEMRQEIVEGEDEESDDKASVIDTANSAPDPGDPLILSYADICKLNVPVFNTPQVKLKNTGSWRNCRNEINTSELGFDNTKDNLEDTPEPLERKIDEEAFSQEFYQFAVTNDEQAVLIPKLEVTPSPYLEDFESEVPGTPILPASARSSSSSRSSDIDDVGFKFRQKEPSLGTPKRVLEDDEVSMEAESNSTAAITPSLKEDLENCVNSTQELKISRKLSILDQEKFLLEPISPIISVEPKSPSVPKQQISPTPPQDVTNEIIRLEQERKEHQLTATKDSSPDFRFHKQSFESPVVQGERAVTPVSATNSTFITDQAVQATNSTFKHEDFNYLGAPVGQDDFMKLDSAPVVPVQVPVVSTPTYLKTILGKKSHRLAKRVNFSDSSEVFYFPRSQGWVSVPKEGGNTLGMESVHIHREMVPMVDQENWNSSPNIGNSMTESYSESDPSRALRPRKSARLSMSTSHKSKKFIDTNTEDIAKKSPELETDNNEWKSTLKKPGVIKLTRVSESKSLPIISENEDISFIDKSPEPIKSTRKCRNNRSFQVSKVLDNTLNTTADNSILNTTKSVKTGELGTRGLDRISSRKRKVMLKSSGVDFLDPKEAEELKIIRENRGRVGCECVGPCIPTFCSCAQGGIRCHQERPGSPCQCREDMCGNPDGRYKFDTTKVQMHFIQTIMETQGAFAIA